MKASFVPSGDHAGRKLWFSIAAARRVGRRPHRAQRLQDDVRVAASVRRVRQQVAVGRPGGRDVERAVDRQPRLVGAVVVGHVDVRDVAIADRPLHPLRRRGRRKTRAWSGPRRAGCAAACGSRRRCRARRRARRRSATSAEPLYCLPSVIAPFTTRIRRASTTMPSAVLRTVPTTTPVGAELLPAIDRHLLDRCRARHRAQDVARQQVELFLVGEVVPQHVGDGLGRGDDFRLLAERDELGHRQLRRRPSSIAPNPRVDRAPAAAPAAVRGADSERRARARRSR